jgi:Flp pilus assembly protein TadG
MRQKDLAMARRRRRPLLGVDGALAVELAITAPLLVLLVLGVTDYGALMGGSAYLEGAARAGAEHANVEPTDTTGIEAQVCGHLGLTLKGGACSPVTPSTSLVCTCVDNTWPQGTACPPTGANPCTTVTNPYTAQIDTRVLQYVGVTATQTYSPLFSYTSFAFPPSLTAQTTTRTQ